MTKKTIRKEKGNMTIGTTLEIVKEFGKDGVRSSIV